MSDKPGENMWGENASQVSPPTPSPTRYYGNFYGQQNQFNSKSSDSSGDGGLRVDGVFSQNSNYNSLGHTATRKVTIRLESRPAWF